MDGGHDMSRTPQRPDEAQVPKVGVDAWVATHAERTHVGRFQALIDAVPRPAWYALFGLIAALLPALTSDGYVIRVGGETLMYMLLALGLNVTVGYAGLLDLGYVAFFGIGAFGYAMLSSPKFGIELDTLLVIPIVVVATALIGFIVALPSRRLIGDYLAIVTLFFGQLFVVMVQNGNKISFLGLTRGYDVTGGPNGIPDLRDWRLGGLEISTLKGYYWTILVLFLLCLTVVYLIDQSRTGRAWKSLREDPLAAELMGMPVNRLKLVAFAFGAGVGGLAGVFFGGLNDAVFAANFDVPTLIVIYAMLILGGAGSLGGVIIGAIVVNVALEVLRTPEKATWIFYVLLLATLLIKLRPWRVLAVVLGGTIAFGYVVHALAVEFWPRGVAEEPLIGGWLGRFLDGWQLHPTDPRVIGNWAFIVLVLAVMGLTLLHGWWRHIAMIPTLYLASFVWDNRLVVEPSVTRLILVGVMLIVLMNLRPQGLLGTARVEIA
jgi:ABC-type branched-subunit amino acid transport system permease subunit